MCKYKHSLTKIEISYIVVFLTILTTDLQTANAKKTGHYTFILVQLWAILCQFPSKFMIFDKERITLNNIVKIRSILK